MIKLTIVTGPRADQTQIAEGPTMRGHPPEAVFGIFLQNEWHWVVDYSQATDEEAFIWFRQDLTCRMVLALKEGRPVHFQGETFTVFSEAEVGRLEDTIANSGFNVTIDRDDEEGLWIGVWGMTQ